MSFDITNKAWMSWKEMNKKKTKSSLNWLKESTRNISFCNMPWFLNISLNSEYLQNLHIFFLVLIMNIIVAVSYLVSKIKPKINYKKTNPFK